MDFSLALEGASRALQDGAEKYGRGDWQKGMPEDEIIDSMLRHLAAWKRGEVLVADSKNGATHLDCLVSGSLMLSELAKRPGKVAS